MHNKIIKYFYYALNEQFLTKHQSDNISFGVGIDVIFE